MPVILEIQDGVATGIAANGGTANVSFLQPYGNNVTVTATVEVTGSSPPTQVIGVIVYNKTLTGFSIYVYGGNASTVVNVNWKSRGY
jgi:hypothetical protein